MSDAQVTLVGNLTREPELRFTSAGKGVCSTGIAVNRRYQVNGEWTEQVSFFNITAWGELGENFAASATKGMRVVVVGRLEQRDWEDKDGGKRTSVEVVADEISPSLRWARAVVEKVNSTPREPATAGAPTRGPREAPLNPEEPF